MAVAKIAITLEKSTLSRLDQLVRGKKYPSRSRVIQEALEEKIIKLERNRLGDECDKLDPAEEIRFAEEGFTLEKDSWPEY
jgi:Arc/MetJ-type ribon-helix-helix transcriptional regulator